MSLDNNDLWKAFVEEVREQLDFLESELVNMRHVDEATINKLFRFFHSIKSSSAIFQFSAMEELAHAAETLLDQIRQKLLTVDDNVVNVLLACVDALQNQLKESASTLQPPTRNTALLQQLLTCQQSKLSAVSAEPSMDSGSSRQLSAVPTVNEVGVDPVELEEFAQLLTTSLVHFFVAIKKGDAAAAEKALARPIKASQVLELTLFARTLKGLKDWAHKGKHDDTRKLFTLCFKLMEQVNAVEKLADFQFQLDDLYDHFHTLFGEEYLASLQMLENQLLGCQHELLDNSILDNASLAQLCAALDAVARHFSLLNLCGSADLFRYFNQACRKATSDAGAVPGAGIFSLIHTFLLEHIESWGEPLRQQLVDQHCRDEFRTFRTLLNRLQDDKFHRFDRIAELTTLLDLEPDYMDYVENSEIELLENCIRENKYIAVLVTDIESSPDWSASFIHWLNQYELITSRTVYASLMVNDKPVQRTLSSFLVAFDDPEEHVQKAIAQLGHGDSYVHELSFRFPTMSRQHMSRQQSAVSTSAAAADLTDLATQSSRGAGEADSNKTIRVNSDAIDTFVSQVGEMVLHRNILSHTLADANVVQSIKVCRNILDKSRSGQITEANLDALDKALGSIGDSHTQLLQANAKLADSVSRVQKDVMALRVVPVSIVFNRLPRVVRNINVNYGKDIRLQITGEQVRIDKSMVDVLMEPLGHLVRNCADHGIESAEDRRIAGKPAQALIGVAAEQRGSYLEIRVSDDGKGLDYPRIREKAVKLGYIDQRATVTDAELKMMIFRAGFSTSDSVTETSGRGVGMDAVRTRITAIGGSIEVESVAGTGTTFIMKLPVSAAIQGVILFRHDGEILTIPERNVVLGLTIPVRSIQSVQGQAAFIHQGDIMPLYSLSQLLGWARYSEHSESVASITAQRQEQEVLIISNDDAHIALAVDKVMDRQEIFVRELHNDLLKLPGVGGASILGNGEVVIILDTDAVLRIASKQSQRVESILRVS